MIINSNAASALYANLKAEFQKGSEEAKLIAKPLVETVPSSGKYNLYGWFEQIPGFAEWKKGEARRKRNVVHKDFTVSNRKFEDTIAVDIDDVNDDQLGQYAPMAKGMGAAGELLMDQLVFDMFNDGFTTRLAYDGLPWFNTAHVVGESTVSNASTVTLTSGHFADAMQAMMGFTVKPDKLSVARPLNPSIGKPVLLVPPSLWNTAKNIVGVKTLAAGGENSLYDAAEIMVSSWLTSTTAWFLINVNAPIKPIFFQDREKLVLIEKTPVNDSVAFDYDELIYGGKRRCETLPTLPWLAYGSTGLAT